MQQPILVELASAEAVEGIQELVLQLTALLWPQVPVEEQVDGRVRALQAIEAEPGQDSPGGPGLDEGRVLEGQVVPQGVLGREDVPVVVEGALLLGLQQHVQLVVHARHDAARPVLGGGRDGVQLGLVVLLELTPIEPREDQGR